MGSPFKNSGSDPYRIHGRDSKSGISGFFRTFRHYIISLGLSRKRLLMNCSYTKSPSFETIHKFRTGREKMLLRIYGDVLGVPKSGFHGSRRPIRVCDTSLERSRRRGSKKPKIAKIRREMADLEVAVFWSFSTIFTSKTAKSCTDLSSLFRR